MVPSPRTNTSVNWLEVIVKTAIIFGLGWFLVRNMLSLTHLVTVPPELTAAEQALKVKNVAGARMQFDKLIAKNRGNAPTYRDIFLACGAYQQSDLLLAYAEQAEQACKAAPKEDQAQMYGALAGAYLECGSKLASRAVTAAQQGYDLDPKSMDSMNSLAYTIAETTTDPVRLKQAEDLILSALSQLNSRTAVPDRPLLEIQYNDTYAWVLYKQALYGPPSAATDKLTVAAELLIDVVNELPDGITGSVGSDTYYHLGAVYNKLGDFAQARNMLDVALYYNPGNADATKELATLPVVTSNQTAPAQLDHPKTVETNPQTGVAPVFTPLRPRGAIAPRK